MLLDRGGHFGVAGCALAVADQRRSKMQRERHEAEREESQGSVAIDEGVWCSQCTRSLLVVVVCDISFFRYNDGSCPPPLKY